MKKTFFFNLNYKWIVSSGNIGPELHFFIFLHFNYYCCLNF